MISDYLNRILPSTEELPCSDDIPVDNEDQNFLPNVLYKLGADRIYQLQISEPYWMPEVGLGIGRCQGVFNGIDRELLAWYDRTNTRYLMPEEVAQQERQRADLVQQQADRIQLQADRLAEQLRALGVDPEI